MPAELCDWIEAATGGRVVASARHRGGASRQAWSVDVERAGERLALFCLRDGPEGSGGSMRDVAVMRALCGTPVPVPRVLAASEALGALLVERVAGRSDFPAVDREHERQPTACDLMRVMAALHALEARALAIAHLGAPPDPSRHASLQLAGFPELVGGLEANALPLLLFAHEWLARNAPLALRTSLVHGDMGPGNFLYQSGAVSAVVDWKLAHWGDPMEDLAALAVSDLSAPLGELGQRFREYERAGGQRVELASVRWYRVLLLARHCARLASELRREALGPGGEPLERFRLLLMRALALCLARESEQALGFADEMLERGQREAARLGPLADRLPQPLEPI